VSKSTQRPLLAKLASFAGVLIGIAGVAFVVRTILTKKEQVGDAFAQLNGITLIVSLLLGL